jgi:hypothetical protein
MTFHAEEEMAKDDLTIFDVESCFLTGEIIERQHDKRSSEWKHIIHGRDLNGNTIMLRQNREKLENWFLLPYFPSEKGYYDL